MWITVENKRKSGDIQLGISQDALEGLKVARVFPHNSPHTFTKKISINFGLIWEEICNYKKVIWFTHISTAVITTNYKYKTFLPRVLFSAKETQGVV